jgi:hypothetical protein
MPRGLGRKVILASKGSPGHEVQRALTDGTALMGHAVSMGYADELAPRVTLAMSAQTVSKGSLAHAAHLARTAPTDWTGPMVKTD